MSILEKIKAEIDRQIEELGMSGSVCVGRSVLLEMRDFVNSLEKEPEVDLEKEIQDWCKENVTGVNPIYTANSLIYSLLPKTARYFYELGKQERRNKI